MCVVGASGEGRKLVAMKAIAGLWRLVEPDFTPCSGLSSGEGLIDCIRDPYTFRDGTRDAGVCDKRLFIALDEFGTAFTAMAREPNNLAAYLRQAHDGEQVLQSLIKKNPQRSTDSHVSMTACITTDEIRAILEDRRHKTKMTDGSRTGFFGLPAGGQRVCRTSTWISSTICNPIWSRLPRPSESLTWAHGRDINLTWSAEAKPLWTEFYSTCQPPAGFEGLIGRAETHVCRLSLIYALLDRSTVMDVRHLRASLTGLPLCPRVRTGHLPWPGCSGEVPRR